MVFHIAWSSPIEVWYAVRCLICACQVQYSTWKHDITSRHHSVMQWNENIEKTPEKLTFNFFQQVVFYPKICSQQCLDNALICFKEDKRIQVNCETVQHGRAVLLSRQKLPKKLSKGKNIDTNFINHQNRYSIWRYRWLEFDFVYSFISFAFLLQAEGRIWCAQEISRKLTTTFDVDMEKEGRSLVEQLPMYERHRRLMNKKEEQKEKREKKEE